MTSLQERRDKETNLDLQERRSQRSLDGFRLRARSFGGRLAEKSSNERTNATEMEMGPQVQERNLTCQRDDRKPRLCFGMTWRLLRRYKVCLLLAWIASGVAYAAAGVRKKKTWTGGGPKEDDGPEEEQYLLSINGIVVHGIPYLISVTLEPEYIC